MRTRFLPQLLTLAVSSIVAFGAVEAAVRVFDLWPSVRARVVLGPAETTPDQAAAGSPSSHFVIHPLIGWALRPNPGWPWRQPHHGPAPAREWLQRNARVNAFGFHSEVGDYRDLTAADFTVGIFGGSVAQNLAMRGGGALVARIEALRPDLAGSVYVLNFAIGGYKQPQQLILLEQALLMGVPFDVVVNLDGFNEIALGSDDANAGRHPVLPSRHSIAVVIDWTTGQPSPADIETAAEILAHRRRADQLRRLANRRPWRHSRFFRALAGAVVGQLQTQAASLELTLAQQATQRDVLFNFDDPCFGPAWGCFSMIADLWQRSSLAMAALSERFGARYLHLLQPNQYVEGSKPLSAEELACCINREDRYSQAILRGYSTLRERGPALTAQGVDYHDMTMVFRDQAQTLYEDTCCHLNDPGNELLGAAVGELVVEALAKQGSRVSEPPAPSAPVAPST